MIFARRLLGHPVERGTDLFEAAGQLVESGERGTVRFVENPVDPFEPVCNGLELGKGLRLLRHFLHALGDIGELGFDFRHRGGGIEPVEPLGHIPHGVENLAIVARQRRALELLDLAGNGLDLPGKPLKRLRIRSLVNQRLDRGGFPLQLLEARRIDRLGHQIEAPRDVSDFLREAVVIPGAGDFAHHGPHVLVQTLERFAQAIRQRICPVAADAVRHAADGFLDHPHEPLRRQFLDAGRQRGEIAAQCQDRILRPLTPFLDAV
ncbi:MAG TPA: hypothetical protein PLE50_00640 [Rhabdaerophilum sp.]|nr:hypothetical protein [Rhabdaerophilum sp.]